MRNGGLLRSGMDLEVKLRGSVVAVLKQHDGSVFGVERPLQQPLVVLELLGFGVRASDWGRGGEVQCEVQLL